MGICTVSIRGPFTRVLQACAAWRQRQNQRRATNAADRLEAAIATLPEGLAVFDAADTLVMCNQSLRDMYPALAEDLSAGADCATLAEALCRSMLAPMSDASRQALAAKLCRDGSETELELADGRWVLHRNRSQPDGGKVTISTDITAVKRRELQLQDSAVRYRDMVERSPVPIYVHRERIVIYANTAMAKALGHASPHDIVGMNIFDLVHPDHHKLAWKRLAMAEQDGGALPQTDMKFRRKDGGILYTEAQVSPITFGGHPAFESILYDISARRRAERALMESEQRYRNLFELSPDAILVHDGHSILFANAAAARMLGADSDTGLFGMDVAAFSAESDGCACPLLTAPSAMPASPAETAPQSCQLRKLDGTPFDAEIVAAPTNHHGQMVQQAVIRDVTRRKRIDATMVQNAKLASLGGMAAGLAHELSQPLNIMRFAAEGGLLKMAKNTMDEAGHAKTYRLIQDQAERMATVMDNMRIFSRKDPGPMQAFDVTLAARNICHLVRNPFRVDDVHIQINAPVSGVKAFGNAIQFEQVLLNLLNNARDAILEHRARHDLDEPGRIVLDCAVPEGGDETVLTVTDSGGGIDDTHLARIFDPFFTTKEEGHGTGLGLALSHEIITAMSGTLEAHSTAGGARFTIRLPLSGAARIADTASTRADTDEIAAAAPVPTAARGPQTPDAPTHRHTAASRVAARQHILVVEDEVEAAWAMAEFLRDEGFEVSIANNGREGLDSYRARRPDAVVTDIRMPGLDGTALIAALRKERADLPIIAVTGHMGDTEQLAPDADAPPVKVMKKPVSLMALSREIGDLLPH